MKVNGNFEDSCEPERNRASRDSRKQNLKSAGKKPNSLGKERILLKNVLNYHHAQPSKQIISMEVQLYL